jgi:uncharacterized protein (TIGR03435 family)
VWQSTLFVVFVWLVTLALRRHDARVRYWLWAAASVKFFVPFSWLIGLGALIEWRTAPTIAQPAATFVMQQILAPPLLSDVVPQLPQDTNIGRWVVLGVWLAGTVVVFLWWARQWRPLRSALRRATPLRLDPAFAGATAGGPDFDAGGLTMMSSPSAFEPGVVGVLRPVLLFPEGLVERLTRAQLDAILAHERAHVRAHDNLLAIVHMTVEAIFWFHPLVWWIERRMIDERERACDEAVIRAGKRPADYAEGILAVCRWSHEWPVMCVSGVAGSDLKRRIEHIMANEITAGLTKWRRIGLATSAVVAVAIPVVIGALANAPVLRAQAQPITDSTPRFDVVSIKRNTDGAGVLTGSRRLPDGSFTATNLTPRQLILSAYRLQPAQVVGAAAWIDDEGYNIEAKPAQKATSEQTTLMIRALLADRFKLRSHTETRELPIYALVHARSDRRLGPGLKDTTPEECAKQPGSEPGPGGPGLLPCGVIQSGAGQLNSRATTMEVLAATLMMNAQFNGIDRLVVDRTGLTGNYQFQLRFQPVGRGGAPPPNDGGQASERPSFFTALQEQLGLKLDPQRAPIEVLVIDSIDRPTEN